MTSRRRLVPLAGMAIPPAMLMVGGSPSFCLKSSVSRLDQTAEQLNAVNGIGHIASLSFARSRTRHTGGQIIPFHSIMAVLSYHLADIIDIHFLGYFVEKSGAYFPIRKRMRLITFDFQVIHLMSSYVHFCHLRSTFVRFKQIDRFGEYYCHNQDYKGEKGREREERGTGEGQFSRIFDAIRQVWFICLYPTKRYPTPRTFSMYSLFAGASFFLSALIQAFTVSSTL